MSLVLQVLSLFVGIAGAWLLLTRHRSSERYRDACLLLGTYFALTAFTSLVWPEPPWMTVVQSVASAIWFWQAWNNRKRKDTRSWLGEKSRALRNPLVRRMHGAAQPASQLARPMQGKHAASI
jgi:hypothetical protein